MRNNDVMPGEAFREVVSRLSLDKRRLEEALRVTTAVLFASVFLNAAVLLLFLLGR